ncbi:hypothetical protein MGALLINA_00290 [Mycoplasmopsis gallinarum]|uniref:Uncharacterized protein n=1 Tax=Mycoplasmopsis gallinarum TaxID=29557 RepID=A0A168RQI7_9BACT|nr:hypothetical protein MGALLINA_00290 [Mycoplasmopsis gallinarum]
MIVLFFNSLIAFFKTSFCTLFKYCSRIFSTWLMFWFKSSYAFWVFCLSLWLLCLHWSLNHLRRLFNVTILTANSLSWVSISRSFNSLIILLIASFNDGFGFWSNSLSFWANSSCKSVTFWTFSPAISSSANLSLSINFCTSASLRFAVS